MLPLVLFSELKIKLKTQHSSKIDLTQIEASEALMMDRIELTAPISSSSDDREETPNMLEVTKLLLI